MAGTLAPLTCLWEKRRRAAAGGSCAQTGS
jgi:hypothetical protein